ncbi:hypothetical protein [Agromyces archimandritae]|uniref:Uncharacterized protein n=1 Tax=Agromyces archimandritae TaxID=2781962 RepID=A0A975IPV3_9MICO|nr:hypothetical protein [Agromyces archimandritae]QTX06038.1 hypothetical protein G127AT_07625 [Agromyces archimandritae]
MTTQFITTHPPQRSAVRLALRQRVARRTGIALLAWSRRSAERAADRDRAVSVVAVAEAEALLRRDRLSIELAAMPHRLL